MIVIVKIDKSIIVNTFLTTDRNHAHPRTHGQELSTPVESTAQENAIKRTIKSGERGRKGGTLLLIPLEKLGRVENNTSIIQETRKHFLFSLLSPIGVAENIRISAWEVFKKFI